MGVAEALFEEIIKGGFQRIAQFIGPPGTPEDRLLDFKRKDDSRDGVIGTPDAKNYSKALSGFANSDGGVLVWGIDCKRASQKDPDVATGLKPITGHHAFRDNLNSRAFTLVNRPVDGIANEAVDHPNVPGAGYVVSLIPRSDVAPHRAEEPSVRGKYFKRNGSSFIALEHYDLEDMFGRRSRPKLMVTQTLGGSRTGGGQAYEIGFRINVTNEGFHLARYVAVEIADGSGLHWTAGVNCPRFRGQLMAFALS